MSDGKGCQCHAHCEHECCCDADWTTKEVYDLRAEVAALKAERDALKAEVSRISLRWEIADHRVSLLWAERDEARRELCHYKYRSIMDECPDANTAPQLIARNRGWDCFEEAKP